MESNLNKNIKERNRIMEKPNLILPGNFRYQPKNLQAIFGYDHSYLGLALVEIAVLKANHDIGIIPDEDFAELTPEKEDELKLIYATSVDKIERSITKHDVRAWVRRAERILGKKLGRWLHIPLTSYDPLDTGRILLYRLAFENSLSPSIKRVISLFADKAEENVGVPQIGRTHLKYALPITIGFWLANILYRIIYNYQRMEGASQMLVGKISGAVGGYNAQVALGFEERSQRLFHKSYEDLVLEKLNLRASPISTQILPPEPLAYFLFSATMLSASLSQFGRDGRILMGDDIGEIAESFEATQVGSSTMAGKRNPINFENVEGTWIKTKNEFGKVMDCTVSELQRVLVQSSPARDFPTILVDLQLQLDTLSRKDKKGVPFISRIGVDQARCLENLKKSAPIIMAEPLYISMMMGGYKGDAHDFVNHQLTDRAKQEKRLMVDLYEEMMRKRKSLRQVRKNIPDKNWELLRHPENYLGKTVEKTREIIELARKVAA
jgi:adenylosuccinate lyase